MNSLFSSTTHVISRSYIYLCSFIRSTHIWQVQGFATILNGNVININLIITFLKDSVFVFYFYVFLHIVGTWKKKKKTEKQKTALFYLFVCLSPVANI